MEEGGRRGEGKSSMIGKGGTGLSRFFRVAIMSFGRCDVMAMNLLKKKQRSWDQSGGGGGGRKTPGVCVPKGGFRARQPEVTR